MMLLCILLNACEKFVSIPNPGEQFEEKTVFSSKESATSVVRGIYGEMIVGGASSYNLALLTGLAGVELEFPSNPDQKEFYYHRINSRTNAYLIDYWNAAYRCIHRANLVYENCGQSSPIDISVKMQLQGEALFIRAYWFLQLVNLFGDIPLPVTGEYKLNAGLGRTSTAKVYEQIIQDLTNAKQLIGIDYVNDNNFPADAERIRPNRACVSALLARVYLYNGKFTEAEEAASEVIGNSIYQIESPQEAFLSRSKEAIWQLALPYPNYTAINTQEGAGFILNNTPNNAGQTALSREIVTSFEEGDLRKDLWISVYLDTAASHPVSYYYAHKFKVKSSSEPREYTMMLRLAEQYLIRAEARVHVGKYALALQDLNVIRQRAGIQQLTSSNTTYSKPDLLQMVWKERKSELFTEQGHHWFDLKRTETCDSLMSKIAHERSSNWKPAYKLFPLPYAEILLKHIQQNPGY
jgi:hypothetical protein